jgi:hypothetical protein
MKSSQGKQETNKEAAPSTDTESDKHIQYLSKKEMQEKKKMENKKKKEGNASK